MLVRNGHFGAAFPFVTGSRAKVSSGEPVIPAISLAVDSSCNPPGNFADCFLGHFLADLVRSQLMEKGGLVDFDQL